MEVREVDTEKRNMVKFITERLFKQAKDWKSYYAGDKQAKWIDDIRFVKGIQWPALRPQEKTSVVINRIWSNIQKELPFMTDRMPKLYIDPTEPADKPIADIIKQIIETQWVERDMERKIPEGTLHAKEVGTTFYRPFWNNQLANGLGDIDCEALDPLECFPFAYTDELTSEKCEGFIWARNVALGWIKKNYEKDGWRVKSQVDSTIPDRAKESNMASDENQVRQVSDMGAGSNYTASETNYLPSTGTSLADSDLQRVTLIKCYLRDGTTQDVEEVKDGKKVKSKKAVYPNGRMITLAGGIILEDEPFAFEFFPYVEQRNYIQPGEFWGESDVKQIKDNQKLYNKILSMLTDALKRGIYTTKFIQTGSGIDADNFYVTSDAAYDTKIPNPVTELAPQALPPQAFAFPQSIEMAIEKTFGIGDLGSVGNPSDLPSGRSLSEYQEATQTRLRQKIRNLEYTVRKIGKAWVEMILKNYTEDRVMRLFNSNTQSSEYVFVFREENPQKSQLIKQQKQQEIIEGTEQKDQTGKPVPGSGQPKYKHVINLAEVKGEFDLTVATGSTVSVSKHATFDQAAVLFKLGAIDRTALLEAAEFPNRVDIIKRMDQQQQAMAQAQGQVAQMDMQKEQMGNQTTMAKAQMDNQTKMAIEQIRKPDPRIQALEALLK